MTGSPTRTLFWTLAKMTLAHAPVVAALHGQAFPEQRNAPWGSASIAQLLAMSGAFGLLALAESEPHVSAEPQVLMEPMGFILCRSAAGECEILTLGVVPAQRRAGVGKELVSSALAAAQLTGAERMFLEVAEDNPSALALYEGLGFMPVGRRRNYYHRPGGDGIDALILSRTTATP